MTLGERIQVATRCAVDDCENEKAPDSKVCRQDLAELWAKRLEPMADGSYRRRRAFAPRDLTWSAA